jgi:radical SAM superfamily enzyme YgiQ (UPF0313 family)
MYIVLCTAPTEPVHIVPPPNVRAMGELPVLPKYAIVSLVKWMEKNGYTAEEYDFYDIDMLLPSQDEIREYFRKTKPDVVGLSAVTSGTYGQIKRLARTIRSVCPDAMIVLGGNLSASANVVLRKTDVDVCVVGDGEVAWVKLLDYAKQHGRTLAVEALSAIKGLSFLNAAGDLLFTGYGEKVPPSDLCLVPDYDLLKKGLQDRPELLSNYFRPGQGSGWFNHDPRAYESGRKPNIAVLVVNKGCVAKCTFCQRPTKGYRVGNMAELEEHVVYLKENHDVGFIMLADENFGSDREAGVEFARIMKKHDLLWTAGGVRCDSMTRELVRTYAENNCVGMKFGIESGSQKILDIMEKKFLREQVIDAVKWCREFKMFSPLAIMFGMPGETEETARETGKLIAEISVLTNFDPAKGKELFYAIPFPGTPLYEYGQQVGVIGTTVEEEERYLENLFSAPSYKLSYVNLNGAPVGEVLFWDVLAQMEAMRYYLTESGKLQEQTQELPAKSADITPEPDGIFGKESIVEILIRKIRTRKWRISMYPFATLFVQRKVIPSTSAAKIPRTLLYPFVKLLLLLEYHAIMFFTKKSGFNYYQYIVPNKGLKRIGDDYQKSFQVKKLVSLRTIVLSNRAAPQNITEENRIRLMTGL